MDISSPASTRDRISWALYDWGSSSFAAIISTFVFPVYFAKQVALDEATGTGQWGLTVGLAGLLVAVGGPILGAIADQYQRRKPWLGAFTLLCVLATAGLWWVAPSSSWVWPAMLLAGLATIGAEFATISTTPCFPA